VARVAALVKTEGNAKHGRSLYLNNKALACITCHSLEGVGGSVGPDLTRVWDTHSLEKVLEAVLDPSKEIKEGYQAYRAVTTDGRVFTGLKVAQTDKEVVLRDATGHEVHIAAKDLEELAASKKSLMPDDVVTHLKFNEFIDLIAFLRDRPAQESLRGLALEFYVVGPVPADMTLDPGLVKLPGAPAAFAVGAKTYVWQMRQADTAGVINLKGFASKDMASFALTHVFSATEQKVQLAVRGADVRVWIDGNKAYEAGPKATATEEAKSGVTLAKGWNSVLVRIGPDGSGTFALRFIGGEGLRLSPRRETDIAAPK
jgi:quinoprotein glucose dehydrogenase